MTAVFRPLFTWGTETCRCALQHSQAVVGHRKGPGHETALGALLGAGPGSPRGHSLRLHVLDSGLRRRRAVAALPSFADPLLGILAR